MGLEGREGGARAARHLESILLSIVTVSFRPGPPPASLAQWCVFRAVFSFLTSSLSFPLETFIFELSFDFSTGDHIVPGLLEVGGVFEYLA